MSKLQSAKPKTDSCSYCCKSVDFRATPPECNDSLRESKTEDNLSYWSQQIRLSKVYVGTSSSKPCNHVTNQNIQILP